MNGAGVFAAVDLGASSGRVIVGRVGHDELAVHEVHRFANVPVSLPTGLHWDVLGLYREVLAGLRLAARHDPVSAGIDSWAVDYGLLDADGALLGNPFHYRDSRTAGSIESVLERIGAAELYRLCGLQQLPINTIYQLTAARETSIMDSARTLLLIPDLLVYWLTGDIGAERTNASTTGLYDATQHRWSSELVRRLDIPTGLLPPLRQPGTVIGPPRPGLAAEAGLPEALSVTAVASHDTASAVAAVPAQRPDFAYISCGTWSLAGLELDSPVLTERSRAANFTNELGVDGTTRYLRNIMGLWLLQECLRSWANQGPHPNESQLLDEAGRVPPLRSLVDPEDPVFLAPRDMPTAIADFCARSGQPAPEGRGETVRCIIDSLALAHRRTLRDAAELSGRAIGVVHVVGGGSRNELLCRSTADACGLPVVAGPAEATALGNILVQARTHGLLDDRSAGRRLVAATQPLRRYEPTSSTDVWAAAERRLHPAV